jgi:exodeoxyribonuclease VII small subunit
MTDVSIDNAATIDPSLSFEDALAALERIVQKLESGKASLDESIDLYARGAALKAHCDAKLKSAQSRIDKLVIGPDGVTSTPMDPM